MKINGSTKSGRHLFRRIRPWRRPGGSLKVLVGAFSVLALIIGMSAARSADAAVGVSITYVGDSASVGGMGGEAVGPYQCPPGDLVVGFRFYEDPDDWTLDGDGLQAFCSTPVLSGSTLTFPTNTLGPLMGHDEFVPYVSMCPTNQVVIGLDAHETDWPVIDFIRLRCAPATLVGTVWTRGPVTEMPMLGVDDVTSNGLTYDNFDCPANSVVGGYTGRVGFRLDLLTFQCHSVQTAVLTVNVDVIGTPPASPVQVTTTDSAAISDTFVDGQRSVIQPSNYTFGVNVPGYTLVETNCGAVSGEPLVAANAVEYACTLTLVENPDLTKAFSPSPILTDGTSTLTWTVAPAADGRELTGLSFTDTFPAGLTIDSTTVGGTCVLGTVTDQTGGTLAVGDGGISVTNFTHPATTEPCTITVDVTAATAGSYVNGSGNISGLVGLSSAVTDQTLVVQDGPDLSVTVADVGPVTPGATATVTLAVLNDSMATTEDTTVVYTLPEFTTVDPAALPAGCTAPSADGPVTCTVAPLGMGGTADLQITLLVDPLAPANATLTGGSATATNPEDTDPSNNTDAGAVTTGPAVVDVEISASDPGPVQPGGSADVAITVVNDGPSGVQDLSVVYTPPTGVTIDAANLPANCVMDSPTAGSVTCDLNAVGVETDTSLVIPVIVDLTAAPSTTLSAGSALSAVFAETDTDGASALAPLTTGPNVADMTVSVSTPAPISPGLTGSITLTAENMGPNYSGPSTIVYTPPAGVLIDMTTLPAECTANTPTAGSITCTVPDLAPDATFDLTINIKVIETADP